LLLVQLIIFSGIVDGLPLDSSLLSIFKQLHVFVQVLLIFIYQTAIPQLVLVYIGTMLSELQLIMMLIGVLLLLMLQEREQLLVIQQEQLHIHKQI
jgi:hypothetical protein